MYSLLAALVASKSIDASEDPAGMASAFGVAVTLLVMLLLPLFFLRKK